MAVLGYGLSSNKADDTWKAIACVNQCDVHLLGKLLQQLMDFMSESGY